MPPLPDPSDVSERDAALAIVRRLRAEGHAAYFAGGCVRDELLGVDPKDYDVATDARPDAITNLFTRTAEVGASFGVVLVREFGPTVEVATFRTDGPYSDARRPDHVEFATAEEDAHRRDFTINALFIDPLADDPAAQIIDHVGGVADVNARVLRAVGDPSARLAEDHLRALRAVRFAAKYGLTIDPGTADAIREHARELAGVSIERVGDEVRRMMGHPTRARAARTLTDLGLDAPIFGERLPDRPLTTLGNLDAAADAMTALAAWTHDRIGAPALSASGAAGFGWRAALNLSGDEAREYAHTLDFAGAVLRDWPELSVAARKRLASTPRAPEGLCLLRSIDAAAADRYESDVRALARDGVGLAPAALIDGDALVERGFQPGPGFGDLLDAVYDAQLEGRVISADDALAMARNRAPEHGVLIA
ncbi:MAG: CCA tRNA nucleotidyltransferase [Phycisphaerales bacterium]